MTPRRGFALPAVLWVIVGLGALSLAASLAARDAVATAQYRLSHARAAWRAEGWAELARAIGADALAQEPPGTLAWRSLDSVIARGLPAGVGCDVILRPAGMTLDVNAADKSRIVALLIHAGFPVPRADSMADAILDWRDADDEPRPTGAERAWYRRAGRPSPRNGDFADVAELRLVRGFEEAPDVAALFGVGEGRVQLARAPASVIASLPGLGSEAVARLTDLRAQGEEPRDLLALAAMLSADARAVMLASYPELSQLVSSEPDFWTLTSRATDAGGATAELELRLVRAGSRIAIVRRRTA